MRCPAVGCTQEGTRTIFMSKSPTDVFCAPASVVRGDNYVLCALHADELNGPSPEALRASLAAGVEEAHHARVIAAQALASGPQE